MKKGFFLLVVVAIVGMVSPVSALEKEASAKLQAALIMKLLPFYNNLGDKEFTIHVIGADAVAAELKAVVGKNAGKAKLINVTQGAGAPSSAADVVYVGSNVSEGISYTQANGVLSVTGNPALLEQGVTLGIGIEATKPKIFLNLTSSKAEKIDWNPAILKVATTL